MTRQKYRENAFLLLFESSFREDDPDELFAIAEEIGEIEVNDKIREFVRGVIADAVHLDAIISSYSPKRTLNRIARTNLILLRMAIYEIQNYSEVPVNVAVSEAVRLSEIYAAPEDTAFINGILGQYVRNREDKA